MTLKRTGQAAVTTIALLALAGCDQVGNPMQALAMKQPAPDEFQVMPREPLRMPMTANLPVPRPGAPSPLDPDPHRDAAVALLGGPVTPAIGHSGAGEQALLSAADAAARDPEIRAVLESDSRRDDTYEPPTIWELFGGSSGTTTDPKELIDPSVESRRLRTQGVAPTPVNPNERPEEEASVSVEPSPYPERLRDTRNKLPSSQPVPAF